METFTQPKITGYRQLSEIEATLMNDIKQMAVEVGELTDRLRKREELDQRWVSEGITDLQKGFMSLVRSVAKPTTF